MYGPAPSDTEPDMFTESPAVMVVGETEQATPFSGGGGGVGGGGVAVSAAVGVGRVGAGGPVGGGW